MHIIRAVHLAERVPLNQPLYPARLVRVCRLQDDDEDEDKARAVFSSSGPAVYRLYIINH